MRKGGEGTVPEVVLWPPHAYHVINLPTLSHTIHTWMCPVIHTDIAHAYNWVYEFVRLQRIQISKRVLKLNLWSVCKTLSKMAKVRRLSQVKGTYSINTQHTQQESCVARAQDSRTVGEPVWKVGGMKHKWIRLNAKPHRPEWTTGAWTVLAIQFKVDFPIVSYSTMLQVLALSS